MPLLPATVIISRIRTGIIAGDGGAASLAQAIRAHDNFVEQAPLTLILLGLAETIAVRPLVVENSGRPAGRRSVRERIWP